MNKLGSPRTAALTAILAAGLLAAGCGSSSTTSSSSAASESTPAESTPASSTPSSSTPASTTPATTGAAQIVKLAADPSGELKYNTTTLTAKPGKVTIEFMNSSSEGHNVTVEGSGGGGTLGATPTFSGGTKSLTLNLKAGTYSFFCSVPGHRQAGMQGTLTVQ
jgi:plastocyanin